MSAIGEVCRLPACLISSGSPADVFKHATSQQASRSTSSITLSASHGACSLHPSIARPCSTTGTPSWPLRPQRPAWRSWRAAPTPLPPPSLASITAPSSFHGGAPLHAHKPVPIVQLECPGSLLYGSVAATCRRHRHRLSACCRGRGHAVAFAVCNDCLYVATSRNFLLRHDLSGESSAGAGAATCLNPPGRRDGLTLRRDIPTLTHISLPQSSARPPPHPPALSCPPSPQWPS